MAGGFITEKYSRIIQAPAYMCFRERLDFNKIIKNLIKLYKDIYVRLPADVIENHKIKKSLDEQRDAMGHAHDALEGEFDLGVRVELGEQKALEIIKKVEGAWKKIKDVIPRAKMQEVQKRLRQIDREFTGIMEEVMEKAEAEDRDAYGDVMKIINASEKTEATVMTDLKIKFSQMKASQLAKWAGKREVSGLKRHIKSLEKDDADIEAKMAELEKLIKGKGKGNNQTERDTWVRKNFDQIAAALHNLVIALKKDISETFLKAYKATKRDLMLMFVLLGLLEEFKDDIREWLTKKLEPQEPEEDIEEDIDKVEIMMGKHARVLAQGLRIIFHKEKSLEHF